MVKLKRTSENQLTKDEYDRGEEDSRFAEEPDPGQGMDRASDETMKKRRIVSASRKHRAPGVAASSSSAPKASAANAFASTKLVNSNSNNGDSVSSNPFAAVQLNAGTTNTTAPSFSFGAAPNSNPKPFSFPGAGNNTNKSVAKNNVATSSTSLLSSSSKSKNVNNAEIIKETNINFFKMIQDYVKNGQAFSDLTPLMEQYIDIMNDLLSSDNDDNDGAGGDANNGASRQDGGSSFSGEQSSNNDGNKTQFSFGGGSSSAAPFSGFAFGSSSSPAPAPATTFSFTAGATPAPAAAAVASATAPTFSFGGAQPTKAAVTAPGNSGNAIANEDDPTYNPDDGKLEVGQEENKDEDKLYEVKVRLFRTIDNAWKGGGVGLLRLYRNNKTSTQRMVLRNDIGKVMFNVAVSKGMVFNKTVKETKKGKKCHITFGAIEDESEGFKNFMFNVAASDLDTFYDQLEMMTK